MIFIFDAAPDFAAHNKHIDRSINELITGSYYYFSSRLFVVVSCGLSPLLGHACLFIIRSNFYHLLSGGGLFEQHGPGIDLHGGQ